MHAQELPMIFNLLGKFKFKANLFVYPRHCGWKTHKKKLLNKAGEDAFKNRATMVHSLLL